MKDKVKLFALSGIAMAMLTGCIDDPYDGYEDGSGGDDSETPIDRPYPGACDTEDGPVSPENGEVFIYGPDCGVGSSFVLETVNGDSIIPVSPQEASVNDHIVTEPVDAELTYGPINVSVTGLEAAQSVSIQSVSESGQGEDLSVADSTDPDDPSVAGGAIMFGVDVKSRLDKSSPVYLTVVSEADADPNVVSKVDITSAINAYTGFGGDIQTVKVPMSCFTDPDNGGVDFSRVLTPFSMEVSSDIAFDLNYIRAVAEEDDTGENNQSVLKCNNDENTENYSEVLTDTEEHTNGFTRVLNGSDYEVTGWASRFVKTHGKSSTDSVDGKFKVLTINETNSDGTPNTSTSVGMRFLLHNDQPYKDISRFIETGVLEFRVKVFEAGDYVGGQLDVRIDPEVDSNTRGRYQNSELVPLPGGLGENTDENGAIYRVPLVDFYNRDGELDVPALMRLRGFTFAPAKGEHEAHEVYEYKFGIADIRLVMDPEANPLPQQ